MGRKFHNILETMGNTPVVKINRLAPASVNLFVKIEAFNPLGSVKDRLALGVIEAAERVRAAQAWSDGHRGDQRQHRHRARHGVRRKRAIRWWSRWPRHSASSGEGSCAFSAPRWC